MEHPIPSAKTVTLIELQFNLGDGTEAHPVRRCTSWFQLDGTLSATHDPLWKVGEVGGFTVPWKVKVPSDELTA
jgi:hypothetical protein